MITSLPAQGRDAGPGHRRAYPLVATGEYNEVEQQIQAGKLRAFGISSPTRLPGIDVRPSRNRASTWYSPIGAASWRRLDKPEDRRRSKTRSPRWPEPGLGKVLEDRGQVDLFMAADQFAAFIKEEQGRIESVLKETGLISRIAERRPV